MSVQSSVPPPDRAPPAFVSVPLRPRFFQSSAYFPMPVVLLATRSADDQVNLAPYSLCFPHVTAEGHRLVLVTRAASKTADNLARSARVSINFIPDEPTYLANCKLLSAPLPTSEKMPRSVFTLLDSELANAVDGTHSPPLVKEAVQVFECRLVSADGDDAERRFVLEVEAIRMQPYWARALETGRGSPRLPVDYGFRRGAETWTSRPAVVVSGPRLRPAFSIEVDRPPELVLQDFRAALARPDLRLEAKVRGTSLQIGMPLAERTTWSPSLDLSVVPTSNGTMVHGRIGPQPQVWTTFMFFHMMIALCGIGGLMWGISQSLAGGSAWPIWISVAALVLHVFVAGAAFIGQGLGADQTYRLRAFVDDVLAP